MSKFFILMMVNVSIFWSCDLNHDWKVTKLSAFRDLSSAALHKMLDSALIKFPGKVLVMDVQDLYGLKGEIKETSESTINTSRTSQEIIDFEARLMSSEFSSKKVNFYSSNRKNYDKSIMYDSGALKKLSLDAGVEYFLRVKLRGYSRIEREYKDRYKHNEHVYQKTVDHSSEISYALLSKEGRYIDFVDDKKSFQERIVFQASPDKELVVILREGFDQNQKKWITETNFLGLDTIVPIAQDVAKSIIGF